MLLWPGMKKDDLKQAPKLLCEKAQVAYTSEYFVVSLQSGTQASVYSLTPQHAKRLAQYLEHQVTEYESKHGQIKAEWSPNVLSPVQPKRKSE